MIILCNLFYSRFYFFDYILRDTNSHKNPRYNINHVSSVFHKMLRITKRRKIDCFNPKTA